MNDLYERLRQFGYKKTFVQKRILPDWWDDALAANPTNRAYAELLLSRELGIDIENLTGPNVVLQAPAVEAHFKTRSPREDLDVAVRLATRLATLAALSCMTPYHPEERFTPRQVRDSILATGASSVNLDGLLDFCWRAGIPVIHLRQVPSQTKRMDGMICLAEGRPVIVIANQKKQAAWHLFIVAHELGHLMAGHLEGCDMVLDEEVEFDSSEGIEVAANRMAAELLAGDADFTYCPFGYPSGEELAGEAQKLGASRRIYPGFVALNYGHNRPKFFGVAAKTLQILYTDAEDATEFFAPQYEDLDLDKLPEHSQHVFRTLTVNHP